jgi:hypothetical protein
MKKAMFYFINILLISLYKGRIFLIQRFRRRFFVVDNLIVNFELEQFKSPFFEMQVLVEM